MTDYTPIDCGLHSEYELAIMQRRKIGLTWRDSQEEHRDTVLPEDIHTRNHAEYLVFGTEDGRQLEIRLDHILHVEHGRQDCGLPRQVTERGKIP